LAAAVPSGQPQPDISTSEKLKTALLSTHHIAVPASTSGIFLMNTVFPKLGVADRVKVTLTDRGAQAVEMLSSKQADFAILPTSELMFAPGIDIIGRLPDQEQLLQVFAVAITTQATNKESARQLIEYLTSSAAQPSIKEGGMDLIANRK
jgi:molybdate transport system substrate-binding protein